MKKWSILLASLIVLEAISAAFYLRAANQLGFPLDDAWIHQTYARNLGLHGLMAFSPGIPSTGSTSAGWTAILALGYFLNILFFSWAYLWGCIFAVATAFIAAQLSYRYFGNFRNADETNRFRTERLHVLHRLTPFRKFPAFRLRFRF